MGAWRGPARYTYAGEVLPPRNVTPTVPNEYIQGRYESFDRLCLDPARPMRVFALIQAHCRGCPVTGSRRLTGISVSLMAGGCGVSIHRLAQGGVDAAMQSGGPAVPCAARPAMLVRRRVAARSAGLLAR